jgi:hypothetical protein
MIKKAVVPVLLATAWVGVSEFARNEFLLKPRWVAHYAKLGIVFPAEPVNGAIWGAWSLLFAVAVYVTSRRFGLLQTALLSWFVGFVLMWVVTGNLGVLPFGLLPFAVPLSLLESFVAALIVIKLAPRPRPS